MGIRGSLSNWGPVTRGVALVIRVGYFCSGGHTEAGGMQRFLKRINPAIKWEKCFPTVKKTKLVPGAKKSTPIREHSGVTGDALVAQMLNFLAMYGRERDFDYILLIDDADCRFKDGVEIIETWNVRIGSEVNAALGRTVHFRTLFASPEIEAWFIADWRHSFGVVFRAEEKHIRYLLSTSDIGFFWENIEAYGGNRVNGSCEVKLSEEIQKRIRQSDHQLLRNGYSKSVHGSAMLAHIEPKVVAETCRAFFAPVFREFQGMAE